MTRVFSFAAMLVAGVAAATTVSASSDPDPVNLVDCTKPELQGGEFCSNTADLYSEPPACTEDTSQNADTWGALFANCVVDSGYGEARVLREELDHSKLCPCYKQFISQGFTWGCQNGPVLKYLAANGFRFGVGQPFLKNAVLQARMQDSCILPDLTVSGTEVSYNGTGSLLGAPTGQGPIPGVDTQCIPACALVCEFDDCAPASALNVASAALMALVAAALALAN